MLSVFQIVPTTAAVPRLPAGSVCAPIRCRNQKKLGLSNQPSRKLNVLLYVVKGILGQVDFEDEGVDPRV